MPKSYAPEVIADNSGKWCGNQLRFATRKEAEENVFDLSMRWTSVRETRVVESDEPVNYSYVDRKLRAVEEPKKPEPLICCICEQPIPIRHGWAQGNNAEPVKEGRCCYDCEAQVVLPARIARLRSAGE